MAGTDMGSVSSKGLPGEGKSPRRSWRSGNGAEPRPKRGSSQPSWAAGGSTGGGGIRRWAGGVLLTAIAVALLGGRTWADGRIEGGATFSFTLPAGPATE